MSLLREYFNVTNSFVLYKVFSIFFPFLHKVNILCIGFLIMKQWQRNYKQNPNTGQIERFLAPREDHNSTDLYIPSICAINFKINLMF